jgi:hypothetical protein
MDDKKYSFEMMDNKTRNLLKNPAIGGIPAMENIVRPKL